MSTTEHKKKLPFAPRLWRYEVTEVDGEMVGRIEVGAIIVDRWKGRTGDWSVHNFTKPDTYVGGWTGRLLGEVTEPETIQQICDQHGWRPRRQGRGEV